MKKTLFSLAFVAASGAYVAAANHLFSLPETGASAVAMDTAAPATISPALAAPVPSTASLQAPRAAPQIIAEALAAPPPLPRSRPVATAPVAIEPAASSTATAATSGLRDGTYTGTDEDAYYGRVQVRVAVANHQITEVKVLDYPQDRRTSRYINSQALPMLEQETIAADTANIDAISGATLTSRAYIRSLGNALAQAGGSNA